jgi:hypothetical protein
MTTKKQTSGWQMFRKQARAHATRMEKQAATTRLMAMADSPVDAFATLWDLAAFQFHSANVRAARLHGRVTPQAPVPVSRLLGGFVDQLREKCVAVAALLQPHEIDRVARVMPGFVAALESDDADVKLLVRDLLPRSPEVIAAWLQTHLDTLEGRFAS